MRLLWGLMAVLSIWLGRALPRNREDVILAASRFRAPAVADCSNETLPVRGATWPVSTRCRGDDQRHQWLGAGPLTFEGSGDLADISRRIDRILAAG